MLAIEFHKMLSHLAKETFPDKDIKTFYIEVFAKESKTRHGDYSPRERKIRIFNLSRETPLIICTTIHELAHHCEFSIYGDTGHSKQFYFVYKQLLEKAIEMGLITWKDALRKNDSKDIEQLVKHFGAVTKTFDESKSYKNNIYKIEVFNCFDIKDILKERGYFYNQINKSWVKEFDDNEIESEEEYLKSITKEENIKSYNAKDIVIEAKYKATIKGGYDKKDFLKQNGFYFKPKNKVWVKEFPATELNQIEKLLRANQLDYKITK